MDFFKKAKNGLKDAQELGKMLGIDKEKIQSLTNRGSASESSAAPSNSTAPTSSSYAGTPASSVAPGGPASVPGGITPASTAVAPSTSPKAIAKMPMMARKSVRDDFENKKGELEEEYSKILGTQWTLFVDAPNVYSYAAETDSVYPKENPGKCWLEYFQLAKHHIEVFAKKNGADGIAQLNRLASSHTMTLEPAPAETSIRYCGCDINGGKLRFLFKPEQQGTNIGHAAQEISAAVSDAAKSEEALGGAGPGPALPLVTRSAIRNDYEAKAAELETEARRQTACPTLTFVPNFEANFAMLHAYVATLDPEDKKHPLDDNFPEALGRATLAYFEGLVFRLKDQNFRKDDMMQEAFKDAVEKNEVVLRIVDQLPKGVNYNDCVIEEGRLIIRTNVKNWWVNTGQATEKMVDLL